MRPANVKTSLKVYYNTRLSLVDPVIVVLQLVIAGYNTLCSYYVNFQLGLVETFILLMKQVIIVLFLLVVGLLTKSITRFNKKEFPYIMLMALSGIFLS